MTDTSFGTLPPDPPPRTPTTGGYLAEPPAPSDAPVRETAREQAGQVSETAREQASQVSGEVKQQARNVAAEVRDKVSEQAQVQNQRLAEGIRRMADELDHMRGDRQGTPAATVVSRIADGGRQVADHLLKRGPEGVLSDVQDFARRRPGAFLVTALATGFVVGRLGKSVMNAAGPTKPYSDDFVSETTSRPVRTVRPAPVTDPVSTTEYPATGPGAPVPVAEEYGSREDVL